MDIKLKNFNRRRMLDRTAFFLCVVLFLLALAGGAAIFDQSSRTVYEGGIDDLLFFDSYQKSSAFQMEFDRQLNDILYLLDQYKSEEYIKEGMTIHDDRMEEALRSLYYGGYNYSGNMIIEGELPYQRYGGRDFDEPGLRKQFAEDYSAQIEEVKRQMIMDDLREYQALKKHLDQIKGFTYFATDGTYSITNLSDKTNPAGTAMVNNVKKKESYLIYENDTLTKFPSSSGGDNRFAENYDRHLESRLDDYYNPDLIVYFSFGKSFLDEKEAEFSQARAEILRWIPMVIACTAGALILLIYLLVMTGRRDEEGNVPVYWADRVFTELQLLIIGFLFVGGGLMFGKFMLSSVTYGIGIGGVIYKSSSPLYLSIALGAIVGLFSAGFGLCFILSVVRNIKAGRFLKNSLTYIILSALWKGVREFYHGGSVMKKVVLVTLAVCVASATIVLAPVAAGLVIIFAPKWVRKYEEIKKGVEEVKNGNLTYKIKADGEGELDRLARGINEISEASNVAVQNELKNQRLKTDLISNVSHDLKTPLTSIITYIDLLKQEGLDSPDAPKYLEILDQKSIRLKKLTEDLFDAAKASSGAIPVKFERVEMLSLINQGLGEMSDRIEASNLEFRINAQKEKYYVRADGQLLWRVVENLLGNVLKYAQENSRVYIDLKEQNGKNGTIPNVIMEMKNISRTELNIDADELMERFKRGDESRTTEGSGLGLAIAKDLIRLQNGWFEIKIDGDLFKAVVMLEAYRESDDEDPDLNQ